MGKGRGFPKNEYKQQRDEVRARKREERQLRRDRVALRLIDRNESVPPPEPIALPPGPDRGRTNGLICAKWWTSHDWTVWPDKCVRCGHRRTPEDEPLTPGVLPSPPRRTSLEDEDWWWGGDDMGYVHLMGGYGAYYAGMEYGSVKAEDIRKIAMEICGSLYWCVATATVAA